MEGRTTEPSRPRAPRLPPFEEDRRRRLTHRAAPLALVGAAAMMVGIVVGGLYTPPERKLADRFGHAWQRGDYAGMYRLISPSAQRTTPIAAFVAAYRTSAATATAIGVRVGHAPQDPQGGVVAIPVTVRTRIFGAVKGRLRIPFDGNGTAARIAWTPQLTFPGLEAGRSLQRRTALPARAAILARDGSALAKGADRASSVGPAAADIVGGLGPIPPERQGAERERGVPDDAQVGTSGLERVFDDQLTGTPSGRLLIGGHVIATARGRPGRAVRTTISARLEQAAVTALAGRLGGVAVLKPQNGEILALAGIAFSSLQPPGSTFKLITTTGALEAHLVNPSSVFPFQSGALLSGVRLSNANGEVCGGSFEKSFAESCNSVFAPLGAKLGAKRLVATAERYGFNERPAIDGAETSTIPPGDQVGDDLAVGSSAIGQGKVQATPLQMASVAATIGNGGRRIPPTLVLGQIQRPRRVTSVAVAKTIRRLMVGVVRFGTGTAAAIPGVTVAGKTGTAELGNGSGGAQIQGDTDAWFVAFAPARAPRFAVGVLLVRAGAGGQAAAPVAREVLVSALQK